MRVPWTGSQINCCDFSPVLRASQRDWQNLSQRPREKLEKTGCVPWSGGDRLAVYLFSAHGFRIGQDVFWAICQSLINRVLIKAISRSNCNSSTDISNSFNQAGMRIQDDWRCIPTTVEIQDPARGAWRLLSSAAVAGASGRCLW